MKTVLHAGCADTPLPGFLDGYKETRLDADGQHNPDLIGTICDLGRIGEYDAVYCSHTLEHVYPYQVVPALKELLRASKHDGHVIIIVPDLEDVKVSDDVLYMNDAYGVTAMDMFYGTASPDNPWMAHHSGFTQKLLTGAMVDAGYVGVLVQRITNYQLLAVGSKSPLKECP